MVRLNLVQYQKTPTNKYYISILVNEDIKQLPKSNNKVGIDLGITDFAITSDGEVFENPKWLRKSERQLAKLLLHHSQ